MMHDARRVTPVEPYAYPTWVSPAVLVRPRRELVFYVQDDSNASGVCTLLVHHHEACTEPRVLRP
jgi:hypothetical protein